MTTPTSANLVRLIWFFERVRAVRTRKFARPNLCLPALLLAVIFPAMTPRASAEALFYEKVAVKTSSEATCMRFASDVARNQGFRNPHSSPAEVAGEKDGAYVSITCVGRGQQNAIAVVIAMAPNFGLAKQVAGLVADRIKGITCFDSPC